MPNFEALRAAVLPLSTKNYGGRISGPPVGARVNAQLHHIGPVRRQGPSTSPGPLYTTIGSLRHHEPHVSPWSLCVVRDLCVARRPLRR